MKFQFIITAVFGLFSTLSFAQTTDTTLIVNGVCEMCQSKIEGACDLDGVESASWSPETKVLELKFDSSVVSLEEISSAINEAGYDTELTAATEEDYEKLHGCCKYRDPEVHNAH